jgi:hypothetical protein
MAQPASSSGSVGKIGLIIALFALAIFFWFYLGDNDEGYVDKDFFYDQSEKQLFTAPRTSVPPIAGINDATEDAVRAVVISVTANPKDKSSHQIAYLEMYTPEMKRQFEEAQRTGNAPPMGRGAAQSHRLVRRHNEEKWHPIISPEGEKIVSEWAKPGSDGVVPVVCTP